jgi:hypothetical protein
MPRWSTMSVPKLLGPSSVRKAHSAGVSFPIKVLLLVVYAAALPALGFGVSAHKLKLDGGWRYSVVNGRLDYEQNSSFDYEVTEARLRWNQAGPVKVAVSGSNGATDLTVVNVNDCELDYLGQYTYFDDTIKLNKCAMNWPGGWYPGTEETYNATPASRRQRTAVHEFGHAMGLRHNGLATCASVMRTVDQDQPTCWVPKKHDKEDVNDYWN